eukprot:scaffold1535_cov382-Prasinococcus_capsulatus_cf.AAC.6
MEVHSVHQAAHVLRAARVLRRGGRRRHGSLGRGRGQRGARLILPRHDVAEDPTTHKPLRLVLGHVRQGLLSKHDPLGVHMAPRCRQRHLLQAPHSRHGTRTGLSSTSCHILGAHDRDYRQCNNDETKSQRNKASEPSSTRAAAACACCLSAHSA